MRVYPTLALLLAAGMLAATAGPGGADNQAAPTPIKLPGQVASGVVRGEHFCAVTSNGSLIDVDLQRRQVRDLGNPGANLLPCLDVAAGKALVASSDHIYLVDLRTGKPDRSLDFSATVSGLGFLGEDRVFVQTGCSVEVVDLAAGKVLHTIATGEKPKTTDREQVRHCRVGRRLYASNASDGSLAVIDLHEGKLIDRIPADANRSWEAIGNIQVVGDKAFVERMFLGYGIWQKNVALLDLTTKKYTRLRLPGNEWVNRAGGVVAGPDGTVLLTGHDNQVWQSDVAGEMAGPVTLAKPGTLVGAWNGQALVAKAELLQLVPLPRPEKEATAATDDPWSGTYLKFAEFDFLRTDGSAPHITITRDGDGYRLSKPYNDHKFIEVEKGVLEDSKKIFGKIYLGSTQFVAGSKKPATVLKAEFCYEHFHLWR
jgi:hypothetical protein